MVVHDGKIIKDGQSWIVLWNHLSSSLSSLSPLFHYFTRKQQNHRKKVEHKTLNLIKKTIKIDKKKNFSIFPGKNNEALERPDAISKISASRGSEDLMYK